MTGGQRFAEPHELAYQDPETVANVGTRAEELAAWNELGFDRITAGIPGLHNTDEGLLRVHRGLPDGRDRLLRSTAGAVA